MRSLKQRQNLYQDDLDLDLNITVNDGDNDKVTGKEESDRGNATEKASGANVTLKAMIAAQAARFAELEAAANLCQKI